MLRQAGNGRATALLSAHIVVRKFRAERRLPIKRLCPLSQAEMGGRAAKTRAALDALDPAQRLAMEGHRPGAYLRLRFSGRLHRHQGSDRQAPAAMCLVAPAGLAATLCSLRSSACRPLQTALARASSSAASVPTGRLNCAVSAALQCCAPPGRLWV